jgi:hypothetical protein
MHVNQAQRSLRTLVAYLLGYILLQPLRTHYTSREILSDDAENPVTGPIQALESKELEKIEIREIFIS